MSLEPEHEHGAEDYAGAVVQCLLVVPGGDSAPLLEPAEGPFDDVRRVGLGCPPTAGVPEGVISRFDGLEGVVRSSPPKGSAARPSGVLVARAIVESTETTHSAPRPPGSGPATRSAPDPTCAVLGPQVEPPPHCLPRREVLRQIPPRRPGAESPDDRLHHLAVVPPPTTPLRRAIRQQGIQLVPHPISQHTARSPSTPSTLPDPATDVRQTPQNERAAADRMEL